MPTMDNTPAPPGQSAVVDLSQHPTAQEFVQRCGEFLDQIEDLTPGKDLEAQLNREHGPGTPIYEELCRHVHQGLDEGWVASLEVDGPRYRRAKVALPSAATRFFSITTVYMDSGGPEHEFSGQYHQHPYGEINCVVALDPGAQLQGMQGWQGPGWTSPGPGTHHYPRARGGRVVALFFLPAGRVSYKVTPDMPQPLAV